jgi:hypothetical protein
MRRSDDDDDVVRDGESVRVPLFLVDTFQFDEDGQPHFVRGKSATVGDMQANMRLAPVGARADPGRLDHQRGYRMTDANLDAARDAVRVAREQWIERDV